MRAGAEAGNRHGGEDKSRAAGVVGVEHDTIVEPFVDGCSERILIIGERSWLLRYESADWRKNVKATVTVVDPDRRLVARARATCERLGLTVAGVDYIVTDPAATLLEVNAYPGFDDVPDAAGAFVEVAAKWWRHLTGSR